MKTKLLIINLLFLSLPLFSQTWHIMNVNKISLPINFDGDIAYHWENNITYAAKIDSIAYLFSQGFYLGGLDTDSIWVNGVASASRILDYKPGNVDSSEFNPLYRLYIINKNDTHFGTSWQNWKDAVKIGAEFYDGDGDSIYNPVDLNSNNIWDSTEDAPPLIGEELAWCVYNDNVPSNSRWLKSTPKGIEIRQSLFAFNKDFRNSNFEPLDYVFFVKYQILNTGKFSQEFDSVYFGIYADPDLGDNWDDIQGCDTILQSGYMYNDSLDDDFGDRPPAHFLTFFQGPATYIPGETYLDNNANNKFDEGIDTPLDSATNYKGVLDTEIIPGAKNLNMSGFSIQSRAIPLFMDPYTKYDAWNYLHAKNILGNYLSPCDTLHGIVYGGIDCNTINPLFPFSGDPVNKYGWVSKRYSDHRLLPSVGPFKLEKDKPIDILIGSTIARAGNNLESVTRGKGYVKQLFEFVQSNFTNFNITDVKENKNIPDNFSLSQNYPNPFNPTTKINYSIPHTANVKLQVYDVLGNLITTIINEEQNAGSYNVELDLSKFSSGVYFYKLQADNFIQAKKMILMK